MVRYALSHPTNIIALKFVLPILCTYLSDHGTANYHPVMHTCLNTYTQPLQDPKEVQAKAESEDVVKGVAMDKMFAGLHGARVFKDFIINTKRAALMPKFLENVSASGSGRCQSQSASKRRTPSCS